MLSRRRGKLRVLHLGRSRSPHWRRDQTVPHWIQSPSPVYNWSQNGPSKRAWYQWRTSELVWQGVGNYLSWWACAAHFLPPFWSCMTGCHWLLAGLSKCLWLLFSRSVLSEEKETPCSFVEGPQTYYWITYACNDDSILPSSKLWSFGVLRSILRSCVAAEGM